MIGAVHPLDIYCNHVQSIRFTIVYVTIMCICGVVCLGVCVEGRLCTCVMCNFVMNRCRRWIMKGRSVIKLSIKRNIKNENKWFWDPKVIYIIASYITKALILYAFFSLFSGKWSLPAPLSTFHQWSKKIGFAVSVKFESFCDIKWKSGST